LILLKLLLLHLNLFLSKKYFGTEAKKAKKDALRSKIVRFPKVQSKGPNNYDTREVIWNKTKILTADHQITDSDVGSVLWLKDSDIKTYLPEGLNGRLEEIDMDWVGRKKAIGLLIREKTMNLINSLNKGKSNYFASIPYKILTGPPGSGRSCILVTIAFWARKNGWLVINISDGWTWCGGQYMVESEIRPSMWDQLEVAFKFFQNLLSVHADKLKQIPLKTKFLIPGFKHEKASLFDLVHFGTKSKDQAGEVFWNFRKELSLVTEFPVLVLIDEINGLIGNSPTLHDPTWPKLRLKPMPTDRMTLPKAMKTYQYHGLINGTVIGAISHFHWHQSMKKFVQEHLSKEPNENLMEIPKMTKEEASQLMDLWQESGYFISNVPGGTRDWIYWVNDGIPSEMFEYCKLL